MSGKIIRYKVMTALKVTDLVVMINTAITKDGWTPMGNAISYMDEDDNRRIWLQTLVKYQ